MLSEGDIIAFGVFDFNAEALGLEVQGLGHRNF